MIWKEFSIIKVIVSVIILIVGLILKIPSKFETLPVKYEILGYGISQTQYVMAQVVGSILIILPVLYIIVLIVNKFRK